MMQTYDHQLIVIGGGPAGSTVARHAAEGGVDVLVIDRREPIGSPLQCGELVPSNDEMRRLCPDVPDMDDPDSEPCYITTLYENALATPSGKPLKFDFEGHVLNRVAHDEFLVELAKQAGADYLTSSRVERVKTTRFFFVMGPLTGQIIVDAEATMGLFVGNIGTKSQQKSR